MKKNSDSFFINKIEKLVEHKNKLRLLCFCEKIIVESVDYFGWYKCKLCKGNLHLKEMAKKIK